MRSWLSVVLIVFLVLIQAPAYAPYLPGFASTALDPCYGLIFAAHSRFGDAHDLYTEGTVPTAQSVIGKRWILKGIASQAGFPLGLERGADPTGLAVNDVVPHIEFVDRETAGQDPTNRSLLDWTTTPLFATTNDWGLRGEGSGLQPVAVMGSSAGLGKQHSLFFELPLYDFNGFELFRRDPRLNVSTGGTLFLYCRQCGRGLVCMGEIVNTRTATPTNPRTVTFLWLEPPTPRR